MTVTILRFFFFIRGRDNQFNLSLEMPTLLMLMLFHFNLPIVVFERIYVPYYTIRASRFLHAKLNETYVENVRKGKILFLGSVRHTSRASCSSTCKIKRNIFERV